MLQSYAMAFSYLTQLLVASISPAIVLTQLLVARPKPEEKRSVAHLRSTCIEKTGSIVEIKRGCIAMKQCHSENDFDAFFNLAGTAVGHCPAAAAPEDVLIPPSTPEAEMKPDVTPSFADVWAADIWFGFGERVSFFPTTPSAISCY
jgi:hypothetical protein